MKRVLVKCWIFQGSCPGVHFTWNNFGYELLELLPMSSWCVERLFYTREVRDIDSDVIGPDLKQGGNYRPLLTTNSHSVRGTRVVCENVGPAAESNHLRCQQHETFVQPQAEENPKKFQRKASCLTGSIQHHSSQYLFLKTCRRAEHPGPDRSACRSGTPGPLAPEHRTWAWQSVILLVPAPAYPDPLVEVVKMPRMCSNSRSNTTRRCPRWESMGQATGKVSRRM